MLAGNRSPKGTGRDRNPEDDAEEQRTNADRPQGGSRECGTDEEEAKCKPGRRYSLDVTRMVHESWNNSAGDRGEKEEPYKPGDLDLSTLLLCPPLSQPGGHEGDRNQVEDARQFDRGSDLKRLGPIGGPRSNDARDIVDGDSGPYAELMLRQSEEVPQGREDEEGEGVQQEDGADGDAHILFLGFDDKAYRGNRRPAADGGPRADQKADDRSDLQQALQPPTKQEDRCDRDEAKDQAAPPGLRDLPDIHREAEQHDASL